MLAECRAGAISYTIVLLPSPSEGGTSHPPWGGGPKLNHSFGRCDRKSLKLGIGNPLYNKQCVAHTAYSYKADRSGKKKRTAAVRILYA